MRVLLTGNAGFLGRHVAARLSQHSGHAVFPYDNYEPKSGHSYSPSTYRADILNFDEMNSFIRSKYIDAIVHLAAYARNLTCQHNPYEAWEVNVNGTLNVLEVARLLKLKRVVVCSSNITLSSELTVYRESKRAVESLVALYASLGVSVMGLRPSNIYGKGQSRTEYQPCAFAGLDMGFERDGHLTINGDGSAQRDWVHVEDVARAFELALASDHVGTTMDVCTGRTVTMNYIAKLLDVPVKYGKPRPGDAKVLVSYPESARVILGFQAKELLEDRIMDAFPTVAAVRRLNAFGFEVDRT